MAKHGLHLESPRPLDPRPSWWDRCPLATSVRAWLLSHRCVNRKSPVRCKTQKCVQRRHTYRCIVEALFQSESDKRKRKQSIVSAVLDHKIKHGGAAASCVVNHHDSIRHQNSRPPHAPRGWILQGKRAIIHPQWPDGRFSVRRACSHIQRSLFCTYVRIAIHTQTPPDTPVAPARTDKTRGSSHGSLSAPLGALPGITR